MILIFMAFPQMTKGQGCLNFILQLVNAALENPIVYVTLGQEVDHWGAKNGSPNCSKSHDNDTILAQPASYHRTISLQLY